MLEEVLRYMGAAGADAPLRQQAASVLEQAQRSFPPKHVYRLSQVVCQGDGVHLPELSLVLPGTLARRMLQDCHHAAVFLCTLGLGYERQARAWQARDMAQALMLDACGSALVEHGCDQVEEELRSRFPQAYLTERFSPGYGDLPLALQPAICAALDGRGRLGVHVSSTCMLTPQKSVTALIGLADAPQPARIRGCNSCALREQCALRKEGHSCEHG